MNKVLESKVQATIRWLRRIWKQLDAQQRFIAFSTGKDSLALTALMYEAVGEAKPLCLYVHHALEFPENLEYAKSLRTRGFRIQILKPHLDYFDLVERGMGFITLKEPWCTPLLIGTALMEWIRRQEAKSCQEAVMFRGMSASEYSHKQHRRFELYRRLNLPCVNPMLDFTRDEILQIIAKRYGLPLNPIYRHMNRSYCICCYTSDARRQTYSQHHYPEVCSRYYKQIEELLFDSRLIEMAGLQDKYKTREEKIHRHGFVHWNRLHAQTTAGAVKRNLPSGAIVYTIREKQWIDTKHLIPLKGRWTKRGNELRFWGVREKQADVAIRRMLNCVDCGFCMVQCLPCRASIVDSGNSA